MTTSAIEKGHLRVGVPYIPQLRPGEIHVEWLGYALFLLFGLWILDL
jgi:hypothetical protein